MEYRCQDKGWVGYSVSGIQTPNSQVRPLSALYALGIVGSTAGLSNED
jgi:hypothetical protein